MRDRLRQRPGGKRGLLRGPNPTDRGKLGSKPSGHRPERTAAVFGYRWRQHARSSGPGTARARDPAHPIPLWAPPQATGEAARGQGLRLRPSAAMAPQARHTSPPRPQGRRASARLGRHRWVVERTASWLAGCRRLHRRYERKPEHFLAFVGISAVLICHRSVPVCRMIPELIVLRRVGTARRRRAGAYWLINDHVPGVRERCVSGRGGTGWIGWYA